MKSEYVSVLRIGNIEIKNNVNCDVVTNNGSILKDCQVDFDETVDCFEDGRHTLMLMNREVSSAYSLAVDVDDIKEIILLGD